MRDLDAYLSRIGLEGRPGLAAVHWAHATSIPFENLDPQRGVPASLEPEALERKLVAERRGGYCFEHNRLLALALEALGYRTEPMLARVRVGAEPGAVRPRSHLVLRVHDGADAWLADVGFGRGTLLEPIPFEPGGPYEQSGWSYRVVTDGAELVLQTVDSAGGGGWADLYAFRPEPVPQVDLETSNWFTSTHPRSPFVTGLLVAIHRPDGSRLSICDWESPALSDDAPGAPPAVTPVAREEIPALLAERFGLHGWRLDADGRLTPAGE